MRTEPPTGDELTRMLVQMKRNVLEQAAAEPKPKHSKLTDRIVGGTLAVALLFGLGTAGAAIAGVIGGDDEPTVAVAATTAPTASAPTTEPPARAFPIETAAPPVDPLTTVATIVIRPEGLELLDASRVVVTELSYDDDAEDFVDVLAEVLDVAPEVREDGPPGEVVVRTFHWRGVQVTEHLREGMHRADTRLSVWFAYPEEGDGVAITTASGFSPGDDLAAYMSADGREYTPSEWAQALVVLETGPVLGPSPNDEVNAHTVVVTDVVEHFATDSIVFAPFNFSKEDGTG